MNPLTIPDRNKIMAKLAGRKSGVLMSFVSGFSKLWLPVVSIGIFAVVGILVWALLLVNPMVGRIKEIDDGRTKLLLIRTAQFENMQANIALRGVLSNTELDLNSEDLKDFQVHRQLAANALKSLRRIGATKDTEELLNSVESAYKNLEQLRGEAFNQWQAAVVQGNARGIDTAPIESAEEKYIVSTEKLRALEKGKFDTYFAASNANTVRVRILMTLAGTAGAITLILLGLMWVAEFRRELDRKDAHITQLREERSALIREVHHRIKNHLQGLLGLIEGHSNSNLKEDNGMATLQGHVLALVSIHGLQAQQLDESVMLLRLLRNQIELIHAGFPGAQVVLSVDESANTLSVAGERAVTLALTITELIVNAIKHGTSDPVVIALTSNNGVAHIAVTNRLFGTTKLNWEMRGGLGTGLSLVDSLVRDLGKITQEVREGKLTMTLDLLPMLES